MDSQCETTCDKFEINMPIIQDVYAHIYADESLKWKWAFMVWIPLPRFKIFVRIHTRIQTPYIYGVNYITKSKTLHIRSKM